MIEDAKIVTGLKDQVEKEISELLKNGYSLKGELQISEQTNSFHVRKYKDIGLQNDVEYTERQSLTVQIYTQFMILDQENCYKGDTMSEIEISRLNRSSECASALSTIIKNGTECGVGYIDDLIVGLLMLDHPVGIKGINDKISGKDVAKMLGTYINGIK